MHSPEGSGGGDRELPSTPESRIELTPEEEEDIIERLIVRHEAIIKTLKKWADEEFGKNSAQGGRAFMKAVTVSSNWERFVVSELLGMPRERFEEIFKKKGFGPIGNGSEH